MGSWIGSGLATVLAIGGVGFVLAGPAGHSHCGPCLGACDRVPTASAPPPRLLPPLTVRYDEPPLARPVAVNNLLQAGFREAGPEVAPMPRPVVPAGGPGPSGPADRY
jgi:hypothetical protein